eukprot:g5306.t1
MQRKWVRPAIAVALLALPFVIAGIYRWMTAPPSEIFIATGPEGGRYRVIAAELKEEIEDKLDVKVTLIHTRGSLDNLNKLESGEVHLAMYQPGTRERLQQENDAPDYEPAFVANVYSEVAAFIVHTKSGIEGPHDLLPTGDGTRKRSVALGQKSSGDYAMSLRLLEHFGLDEHKSIDARYLSYSQIARQFADGKLDAAFITTGTEAPILRKLLASGHCRLVTIPNGDALSLHHISLTPAVIPAGLYHSPAGAEPKNDIPTVAFRAQLLTRKDIKTGFVRSVVERLLDERFLRDNRLLELFRDGKAFARHKPEFSIHPGASQVYDPELRPVLNSDFVEAMEGMRSFLVSILIAGFLLFRWLKDRRVKKQEHRLDRYIHKLLDIERRQFELDETQLSNPNTESLLSDIEQLQKLLDEVTSLRQDAFGEFTAHQLSEDRATDCFLEMRFGTARCDRELNHNPTNTLRPFNRRRNFMTVSRRDFLAASGTAVGTLALGAPLSADTAQRRKLAVVTTVYRENSHADHIAGRFIKGYTVNGKYHRPDYDVVSMHVEQIGPGDLSRGLAKKFGFRMCKTIAEALILDAGKLDVDGVLLIGEHGNYPDNKYTQRLYPRHRLMSGIVDVFRKSGRAVPVFNDKHLSYSWKKSKQMVDWSRELKFPLQAGSSLPVTWRRPELELPLNTPISEALAVAFSHQERYGFHALETLQCHVERRKGGETGIKSVTALRGDAVWKAGEAGRWSKDLMHAALSRSRTVDAGKIRDNAQHPEAFLLEYRDGFRATVLMLTGHTADFTFAAKLADGKTVSTLHFLPNPPGAKYFDALCYNIERMLAAGKAVIPIERTLLVSGALESLMHSRYENSQRKPTPHLGVKYTAPKDSGFFRGAVDPRLPTGRVTVDASEPGHPKFTIHENVAWDAIAFDEPTQALLSRADAVCFGTLAQRSTVSRNTIQHGLETAARGCLKVFDVNLRQEWYTRETIEASLHHANILKLNTSEVDVLTGMFALDVDSPTQFCETVRTRFEISRICITRAENGCLLNDTQGTVDVPGAEVNVVDAVGAGDSLTAALIYATLSNWTLDATGRFANAVGSLKTTRAGAMPDLKDEFAILIERHRDTA